MKFKIPALLFCIVYLSSCTMNEKKRQLHNQIMGTWKLISATTTEKGKHSFTDYTKTQSMIKVINDTHFAFLKHNLKPDENGKNNFDAGGGRYSLAGDQYTEFLDYYADRNWERKSFVFTVRIQQDTLIQTGVEKVEQAGVDRIITERYFRVKSN